MVTSIFFLMQSCWTMEWICCNWEDLIYKLIIWSYQLVVFYEEDQLCSSVVTFWKFLKTTKFVYVQIEANTDGCKTNSIRWRLLPCSSISVSFLFWYSLLFGCLFPSTASIPSTHYCKALKENKKTKQCLFSTWVDAMRGPRNSKW